MRILIDDKIPYISGFAEQVGETFYKNGVSMILLYVVVIVGIFFNGDVK